MSNTEAINEIKRLLLQNISQKEAILDAETFAMSLLTRSSAIQMVKEINNEEDWYGLLMEPVG